MKVANHKLYYGTGLSWDYIEHLRCYKRGGHVGWQRYKKRTDWNKTVRRYIKRGVYDGVNLYKNLEEITKDFLLFPIYIHKRKVYMTKEKVTYEQSKQAAQEVKEQINNGSTLRGPEWVWPTFHWGYTLQEWHYQCVDNGTVDEFEEIYNIVHSASTYNWHMYEDIEY